MFLNKTATDVFEIAKNIKDKLEFEETIYLLNKSWDFVSSRKNFGKMSRLIKEIQHEVNKLYTSPVIPSFCVIRPPYNNISKEYYNFTACLLYAIIKSDTIISFINGNKTKERIVRLVTPSEFLPNNEDPLLTELENTLDSLNINSDLKWLRKYGFAPVKTVNDEIVSWLRLFSASKIMIWRTEKGKWQAKALWYERGLTKALSKEYTSYKDALKEILPGLKKLFNRENVRLAKGL